MNKIGGLWQNKSQKGETYFSGKVNDQRIVIFKNKNKQEGEKYPDWIIYESETKDKKELPPKKEVESDVPF